MHHPHPLPVPTVAISKEERGSIVELGTRIAEHRKDQGLTQAQLADAIGVAQQTITTYEVGRRRVPATSLALLAQTLGWSLEELIGASAKFGKRGPAPKLQQQLERIARLPKAQQRFVMQMIDTVLQQQASR